MLESALEQGSSLKKFTTGALSTKTLRNWELDTAQVKEGLQRRESTDTSKSYCLITLVEYSLRFTLLAWLVSLTVLTVPICNMLGVKVASYYYAHIHATRKWVCFFFPRDTSSDCCIKCFISLIMRITASL